MAAYTGPFPTPETRLPTWIFARQIRRSEAYLSEVEAGLAKVADKPALIMSGDADGAFRAPDRDRFAAIFLDHRIVVCQERSTSLRRMRRTRSRQPSSIGNADD